MGLRDKLLTAGRGFATAAGNALLDLSKAEERITNNNQASAGAVPTDPPIDNAKSLLFDPFSIIEQLGFREKPTSINYRTLKMMVRKTQIIEAIIGTRLNQVAEFSKPSHDRYTLGFRIKLRDSEREPTKQDKIWIRKAEEMIMSNGVPGDYRVRNSFETFLKKTVRDSLELDQMCWEIVPNRKGQPAEWYAVDSSSIRLADSASTFNKNDPDKTIRYVQIYDGIVINEYTAEEMCFGVRNPRTDMLLHGYGVSEVEALVQTVTSLLWSWQYNEKAFSNSSFIPGILNFKGKISDKTLDSFRRHWYQMLSGVNNAFKNPITNADEVEWIKIKDSNRDMEYNAWMDFLIKVACAIFKIDPIELNFKYGNAGQRNALNEANNKEKITESKERGLRPILRFLANCFNSHIIWQINPNFEFQFYGLDSRTREAEADLSKKLVTSTRTVDELRAEDDLEPLPNGLGEVILDNVWLQNAQQVKNSMEQQQQGAEDEGGGQPPDFTQLLNEDYNNQQEDTEKSLKKSRANSKHVIEMEI